MRGGSGLDLEKVKGECGEDEGLADNGRMKEQEGETREGMGLEHEGRMREEKGLG